MSIVKLHWTLYPGPILEYTRIFRACNFAEKGEKGKKEQTIGKFERKCTKFENILKQGWWLRAIIARNKLLKQAMLSPVFIGVNNNNLFFFSLKDIENIIVMFLCLLLQL